ncbi:MAG: hypothetical protein HFE73_11005 [Firmicutes bacterium]|nr:hypothetical protein [Bacillota bacterium]
MSRTERRKQQTRAAGAKKRRNPIEWFKNLKTWKKAALLTALVVILAAIIIVAMVYGYVNDAVDQMHEPTPESYDLSLVDVDGYINILLLGVDSRNMNNINGTRSDAIMIVSINKDTNDVKVISVYRDTFLKMGDTGSFDKITHACAYGGPELSIKSLNQAMDLNISNYVVVNFKAVADLVDAVGGITVNVEDYEIQQLNKYTIQTANNIGRENYKLVEAAGTQTLEGVQAVSYGRIRKGVGDDFKRTERMRTVLTLVFNKMKTMSFSEIKGLIDMMIPQVKTNLDMGDILGLAYRLPSFNIIGSVGWPYNVTSGYIGGVSYVLPQDLVANTTKLHQEVFGQSDYVPSAVLTAIAGELATRIQGARDSNEISGEKPVDTNEKDDPTQVPDDPVNPDNPDDPAQTDPGNPGTETPDDPTTDPNNPQGPTDPNNPGNPNDPGATDPNNPGTSTDPNNPGTSTDPSNPQGPTDPGNQTDPNNPQKPVIPDDADDPDVQVSQPGT